MACSGTLALPSGHWPDSLATTNLGEEAAQSSLTQSSVVALAVHLGQELEARQVHSTMTPHCLLVLHALLQRASCTRQTRACHAAGRNAGALVLPRVGASRPGSSGWKDLHSWPGPAPEARNCRLQRVPGRYATPPVAVRTTKLTTDLWRWVIPVYAIEASSGAAVAAMHLQLHAHCLACL